MQKAMTHKNEKKQEYKNEYAKKSSVEGPFGILKEQFQIEKKSSHWKMTRTEKKST